MFIIRAAQEEALAKAVEAGTLDRAIEHLRSCIPEACAALTEQELRDVVRWGRRRSRHYGIERERDFFRYLNLMFMFGFEFDTDLRYPWAGRTLTKTTMHPVAKIQLLMDHAMLACSRDRAEDNPR